MLSLTDFLNHGLLPFVGRSAEIDALMRFWRSSIDVGGLRVAVITAEAGAGKTRLLDQLLPRIAREGGMVVRARLYPDSSASIAPLMAQALGKSGMAFRLLKVAPDGTMAEVVTTFRRVARLRPVVLMIEDLHLLQGEALRELGTLFHTLSDEDITVLCAARPMDPSARGMLERYAVIDIELHGLERESIEGMWRTLFGTAPLDSDVGTILDVTLGNPLAIRSALRGAISSGMIAPAGTDERWEVQVEQEPFARALQQGVRVLSEGMAAQLTESEREDGAQLACLGEIFAREAAEVMIDAADRVIERLLYKGLLVTTDMPSQPFAGAHPHSFPATAHPLLAFTHSLVHRQFVDRATLDVSRLVTVMGSHLPLYSVLPFELLGAIGESGTADVPIDMAWSAITRAMRIIYTLDFSPDRHLALTFWHASEAIFKIFRELWSDEQRHLLEADLIFHKLAILRHTPLHPEHDPLIDALFAVTAEPTPDSLLLFRMRAFAYKTMIGGEKSTEVLSETWDQVEDFLGRYPSMRYHHAYIHFLHVVAHRGRVHRDKDLLRMVEQHAEKMMASEGATDHFRRGITDHIAQFFLLDFSTEAELARRRQIITEIEKNPQNHRDISFLAIKLDMHEILGEIEQAKKLCAYTIERTAVSNPRAYLHSSHTLICCTVCQGEVTLQHLLEETERLLAEGPEWCREPVRWSLAPVMSKTGLMAGDIPWTREIVRTFAGEEFTPSASVQIVLALLGNGHGTIPDPEGDEWEQEPLLMKLATALRAEEAPTGELMEEIRATLLLPPVHDRQLFRFHGLIPLVERASLADELREEIRTALNASLEWLAARSMFVYMRAFINYHGHLLDTKQGKEWRKRIAEIEYTMATNRPSGSRSRKINASMLGTIEVTIPDKETIRPRGSRLRLFLGVLVADAIMKRRLSFQEMAAIVSTDGSGERGRKALNEAVYRLRELLGHDAVITDEEVPRLNTGLVDVDLIQAHDRLRTAATALQGGSLLQAHRALLAALKLTHGEVPFPGLYEDFFEHAREEFDYLLRSTLIGVGQSIIAEGDLESAEELLERGLESIPEDEDIAALLSETLERMGRKASAGRIRARMEEEEKK